MRTRNYEGFFKKYKKYFNIFLLLLFIGIIISLFTYFYTTFIPTYTFKENITLNPISIKDIRIYTNPGDTVKLKGYTQLAMYIVNPEGAVLGPYYNNFSVVIISQKKGFSDIGLENPNKQLYNHVDINIIVYSTSYQLAGYLAAGTFIFTGGMGLLSYYIALNKVKKITKR